MINLEEKKVNSLHQTETPWAGEEHTTEETKKRKE